jgi:hypothetical protein
MEKQGQEKGTKYRCDSAMHQETGDALPYYRGHKK